MDQVRDLSHKASMHLRAKEKVKDLFELNPYHGSRELSRSGSDLITH